MPQLSLEQRKRDIDLYHLHGSYGKAAEALNKEFPTLNVTHSTIQFQVKKIKTPYCLQNRTVSTTLMVAHILEESGQLAHPIT